jgi:gamma-glutamyl-gamma-aminobutyrate hydrolase PuuD
MIESTIYLTEDETKPIIGISGYKDPYYFSVAAAAAQIRQAGGIPLYLSNQEDRNAADDIKKLDGLIILGNRKDMDPKRYNEEELHPSTDPDSDYPDEKARADYEFELIELALQEKIPLLGICAGMQKINVACGGTLHQHIPELVEADPEQLLFNQYFGTHCEKLDLNVPPFVPVEQINIIGGSELAKIATKGKFFAGNAEPTANPDIVVLENSLHHQAVDKIGEGLIESAYLDFDGVKITEAIEADQCGKFAGQFLVGTQWHPELAASDVSANIVKGLITASKQHRQQKESAFDVTQAFIDSMDSSKVPDDVAYNVILTTGMHLEKAGLTPNFSRNDLTRV